VFDAEQLLASICAFRGGGETATVEDFASCSARLDATLNVLHSKNERRLARNEVSAQNVTKDGEPGGAEKEDHTYCTWGGCELPTSQVQKRILWFSCLVAAVIILLSVSFEGAKHCTLHRYVDPEHVEIVEHFFSEWTRPRKTGRRWV